jgi:hypothetical protein
MLRRDQIRAIVAEHGVEGYLHIQQALLEGRKTPDGRETKPVAPERFSIRALWEGLVGPVEETLAFARDVAGYVEMTVLEAAGPLVTTGFPSAVGQLISSKVIDGYEQSPGIGDQLVTTMPSKLRGERIVGFTSLQGPKVVPEGKAYEESTMAEKYVTSVETKRGRLLSITEELVFFDQTGQVMMRASALGDQAKQERERRIVRAVADVASAERVYRPSGTAEQLYASGNNNLLSTATPLADWTDIQEVLVFHATNITDDREPDDEGSAHPIAWVPRILLTAQELAGVAARIIAATMVIDDTTGVHMQTGNPLSRLIPGGLSSLSSPYLDEAQGADQWDDASDWLLGDFKKQFVYKEIWPLQVFRAPAQHEEQFERDVVARFKVREYGDVNAVEERFVVKVNAVT